MNKPEITNSRLMPSKPWYGNVSVCWLLALAVIYTLYFTKAVLVPMMMALLLALLLNPLISKLKRIHVPRSVSALFILGILCGCLTLVGAALAEPAQKWFRFIPELSDQLSEQIDNLSDSLNNDPEAGASDEEESPAANIQDESGFGLFGFFSNETEASQSDSEEENPITERIRQSGMEMVVYILGATPLVIAQVVVSVILILFFLVFGPQLFNTVVTKFPHFDSPRHAIHLARNIQQQLSRYILTVSMINIGLGFVTGVTFWFMGVQDAILWGVLIALLNYAPYVGPIFGIAMIALAGIAQYGMAVHALAPALAYFLINLIEAQVVTPVVLGTHMRLNPLLIIIWVLFWGWMWGAVGVLLAMPMMVSIKLTLEEMGQFEHWVSLIET